MFKKPPHHKGSANIKSSERRKLLQSIGKTYGIDIENLEKEDQLKLLPATIKQSNFKNDAGVSGTIYFDDQETPVWFKQRDSVLYPSVFTCWRAGPVLPVITTHPHVIGKLAGGADLMLPGTVPPFDKRATKGVIVGVVDSAAPSVIKAVGKTLLNMTQFDRVIGRTGVAVEVIHVVNDELYGLSKEDHETPDAVEAIQPKLEEEDEHHEDAKMESTFDQKSEQETQLEQGETEDTNEEDFADEVVISVEDLDQFFMRSLFQTIKTSTMVLPIPASTFMSQYIYKNLPVIDPSYANVKKSSWKKTAKFLKAMDKQNYLTVKGKDDDLQVVKLMGANSPQLVNFVPHKTLAKHMAAPIAATASKKSGVLTIKNWYKPTGNFRPLFNEIESKYSALYTAPEVKGILDSYIKKKNLVDRSNPKNISVDEILSAATNVKGAAVPRDQLAKSFLAGFSAHCEIIKPGQEKGDLYKGLPPKIQVLTETKIGRKTVTRVSDFERFYIKPQLLADELKTKCQGSATIHECVQNPKLMEVQIQGPHGNTITELLKSKWGVPASFIKFEDKSKRKKKK